MTATTRPLTDEELDALRADIKYALDLRHNWQDRDDADFRILAAVRSKSFLATLDASRPSDGLRAALERIEALPVYRYILPQDDESTPTRAHRPFDMVRRDQVLAALATPADAGEREEAYRTRPAREEGDR